MNDLDVVIPWFLVGMGCGCVYGMWIGRHRSKMVGKVVVAVLKLGGSASIGEVWREIPGVTLRRLAVLCDMAVEQGFLVSRYEYIPTRGTGPAVSVRYLAVNQ